MSTSNQEIDEELHVIKSSRLSLKDYAHLYATIHCNHGISNTDNIMTSDIVTTILTQYHVSKGIKIFSEKGVEAVLTELQELHNCMIMKPVPASSISRVQKKATLQYLMFLKQKRSGKIKGQGCADGRKQRLYMNKDNVSSPTVSTQGLLLTCIINAMEQ